MCGVCGGSGVVAAPGGEDEGEGVVLAPCPCPAGDRVRGQISADVRKEADKLDD